MFDDDEPPLNARMLPQYRATWGDKKQLCQYEAQSAIEEGIGPENNPYRRDSWPWRWWNEAYLILAHIDNMYLQ